MCGTDMCEPFPTATGVVASISFTINPPSTNSRIVCRHKDRGGCGCSRRWSCLVSEQFTDGSYIRGWLKLFRSGGGCLLRVISSRGCLCYSGYCSSSLARLCFLGC